MKNSGVRRLFFFIIIIFFPFNGNAIKNLPTKIISNGKNLSISSSANGGGLSRGHIGKIGNGPTLQGAYNSEFVIKDIIEEMKDKPDFGKKVISFLVREKNLISKKDFEKILKAFTRNGGDVDSIEIIFAKYSTTLLSVAIIKRKVWQAILLLEFGADINNFLKNHKRAVPFPNLLSGSDESFERSFNQYRKIIELIKKKHLENHLEIVRDLLSNQDSIGRDAIGYIILGDYSKDNRLKMLEYSFKNGAKARRSHIALVKKATKISYQDKLEFISLLIRYNSDLFMGLQNMNNSKFFKDILIEIIRNFSDQKLIKSFLVSVVSNNEKFPIDIQGSEDVFNEFIKKWKDIDLKLIYNNYPTTLLGLAIRKESVPQIVLLLQMGADIKKFINHHRYALFLVNFLSASDDFFENNFSQYKQVIELIKQKNPRDYLEIIGNILKVKDRHGEDTIAHIINGDYSEDNKLKILEYVLKNGAIAKESHISLVEDSKKIAHGKKDNIISLLREIMGNIKKNNLEEVVDKVIEGINDNLDVGKEVIRSILKGNYFPVSEESFERILKAFTSKGGDIDSIGITVANYPTTPLSVAIIKRKVWQVILLLRFGSDISKFLINHRSTAFLPNLFSGSDESFERSFNQYRKIIELIKKKHLENHLEIVRDLLSNQDKKGRDVIGHIILGNYSKDNKLKMLKYSFENGAIARRSHISLIEKTTEINHEEKSKFISLLMRSNPRLFVGFKKNIKGSKLFRDTLIEIIKSSEDQELMKEFLSLVVGINNQYSITDEDLEDVFKEFVRIGGDIDFEKNYLGLPTTLLGFSIIGKKIGRVISLLRVGSNIKKFIEHYRFIVFLPNLLSASDEFFENHFSQYKQAIELIKQKNPRDYLEIISNILGVKSKRGRDTIAHIINGDYSEDNKLKILEYVLKNGAIAKESHISLVENTKKIVLRKKDKFISLLRQGMEDIKQNNVRLAVDEIIKDISGNLDVGKEVIRSIVQGSYFPVSEEYFEEALKIFASKGGDIDSIGITVANYPTTPLSVAIIKRKVWQVILLLKFGSDIKKFLINHRKTVFLPNLFSGDNSSFEKRFNQYKQVVELIKKDNPDNYLEVIGNLLDNINMAAMNTIHYIIKGEDSESNKLKMLKYSFENGAIARRSHISLIEKTTEINHEEKSKFISLLVKSKPKLFVWLKSIKDSKLFRDTLIEIIKSSEDQELMKEFLSLVVGINNQYSITDEDLEDVFKEFVRIGGDIDFEKNYLGLPTTLLGLSIRGKKIGRVISLLRVGSNIKKFIEHHRFIVFFPNLLSASDEFFENHFSQYKQAIELIKQKNPRDYLEIISNILGVKSRRGRDTIAHIINGDYSEDNKLKILEYVLKNGAIAKESHISLVKNTKKIVLRKKDKFISLLRQRMEDIKKNNVRLAVDKIIKDISGNLDVGKEVIRSIVQGSYFPVSEKDFERILKAFTRKGGDIDSIGITVANYPTTPLSVAIIKRKVWQVILLLKFGSDIKKFLINHRSTAFLPNLFSGDNSSFEKRFNQYKQVVEFIKKNNPDNLEVIRSLLGRENKKNEDTIHYIIKGEDSESNKLKMLKYSFENGAIAKELHVSFVKGTKKISLRKKDKFISVLKKNMEVMEVMEVMKIIEKDDVDEFTQRYKENILKIAYRNPHLSKNILRFFLENSISIPLKVFSDIIYIFLREKSIDTEIVLSDGRKTTLLGIAMEKGNYKQVVTLIKADAEIDRVDSYLIKGTGFLKSLFSSDSWGNIDKKINGFVKLAQEYNEQSFHDFFNFKDDSGYDFLYYLLKGYFHRDKINFIDNLGDKTLKGHKLHIDLIKNNNNINPQGKSKLLIRLMANGIVDKKLVSFRGADISGTDMSGMDLSGVDFEGAIFRGTNITGTNFTGANLKGVNFKKAIIDTDTMDYKGTVFKKAKMQDVDFSGKDLRTLVGNIDFTQAMLTGADFSNTHLSGVIFTGANLENSTFEKAKMNSCKLDDANLTNVNLRNVDLSNAKLQDGILRKAILEGSDLSFANIEGADISDAKIEGLTIDWAYLTQTFDFFKKIMDLIEKDTLEKLIRAKDINEGSVDLLSYLNKEYIMDGNFKNMDDEARLKFINYLIQKGVTVDIDESEL